MPFKVMARTLLHLGAELISSDAIAFYELIKNAFDAGSKRAEINVVVRIPYETLSELRNILHVKKDESLRRIPEDTFRNEFRNRIRASIASSAPETTSLEREIAKARSWEDFEKLLEKANYIVIKDTGEGMSLSDLNDVYLTIGTRSRLMQRKQMKDTSEETHRPILGEKGVGRLSVMRLGRQLKVTTSKKGEKRWNVLEIDWGQLSHNADTYLEEFKVSPQPGALKENSQTSGTTLYIIGLTSAWSEEKLKEIAKQEFSKLTDPFVPKARYPIALRFNGDLVSIDHLDKIVFEWAHATVDAEFWLDELNNAYLEGTVDYCLRKRKKTFSLNGAHLISTAKASPATFKSLGPFKMKLYWYNRPLLNEIEGIGDRKRVKDLVKQWAGGLMVYRDGFRVSPYGGPDDDWLDIDRIALASGGYKVNRRQIIGKVDISAKQNPRLIDQTNREGLSNSDEKQAFIKLLQHIITVELRTFLNKVDAERQAREPISSFGDLAERVGIQEEQVQTSLQLLVEKYPQLRSDNQFTLIIREITNKIQTWMKEAQQLAESYEKGRSQLLHLAGLGLMVEILAHELNRATIYTLTTLADVDNAHLSADVKSLFSTLESQLKTLQKRLRILDPLSTSGRQVKETFDLINWVQEILASHQAQFRRHGIRYSLRVEPDHPNPTLSIKSVKGMIVQILENLISNSVYWFKQERIRNKSFTPKITITIYTHTQELHFTDNGPGVDPEMKDDIFQPFVTTKPPGEGKGLGLFISREIAHYNGAILYLLDQPTVHSDTLNTFVFSLAGERS